jgi:TRAP-type C4-dicarboxylate transport system permease small subunit
MTRLIALRTAFRRLLETVTILLMLSLTVVVVLGVVYRLLGVSLAWYDEVASVQLAWLTYYGAALGALNRAHIGVPGVLAVLPPGLRLPLTLLAEAVVVGFFVLLAWLGTEVLIILEGDTLISLPEVSTQVTQSVIPIGAVLFIIAELLSLPEVLRAARGGAEASAP